MPWEGRQGVFILTPVAEPHQRGGPRAQCSSVQWARAASRSRAGDGTPWGAPCSVRKHAMLAFSRPLQTRTLTRAFLEAEAWPGGRGGGGLGKFIVIQIFCTRRNVAIGLGFMEKSLKCRFAHVVLFTSGGMLSLLSAQQLHLFNAGHTWHRP